MNGKRRRTREVVVGIQRRGVSKGAREGRLVIFVIRFTDLICQLERNEHVNLSVFSTPNCLTG